jgi:hypothetical protein
LSPVIRYRACAASSVCIIIESVTRPTSIVVAVELRYGCAWKGSPKRRASVAMERGAARNQNRYFRLAVNLRGSPNGAPVRKSRLR